MITTVTTRSITENAFCDPLTHETLLSTPEGLRNSHGTLYKFVDSHHRVINFIEPTSLGSADKNNIQMYDSKGSIQIYRNFLNWLFLTFEEKEEEFRKNVIAKLNLSKGMKVLVTGCGLGDDLSLIVALIGEEGELHAQDLSKSMVMSASDLNLHKNLHFTVSNACVLPYTSRYFDAVYHFGGINLFGDIKQAISELERVCKIGGIVLFGDEGIASHLKGTQYAEIAINNIKLWEAEAPLHLLPHNASDIQLTYVLGNCFYLISFSPSPGFPRMNIDVKHEGYRGGTAKTRFFGKLEGVTEETKEKLVTTAKLESISMHDLLEEFILSGITNRFPKKSPHS